MYKLVNKHAGTEERCRTAYENAKASGEALCEAVKEVQKANVSLIDQNEMKLHAVSVDN
jgi:hypothetical protein